MKREASALLTFCDVDLDSPVFVIYTTPRWIGEVGLREQFSYLSYYVGPLPD